MTKELSSAREVLKEMFGSAIRPGDLIMSFEFKDRVDAIRFSALMKFSYIHLASWMPDVIQVKVTDHDMVNEDGKVILEGSTIVELRAAKKK